MPRFTAGTECHLAAHRRHRLAYCAVEVGRLKESNALDECRPISRDLNARAVEPKYGQTQVTTIPPRAPFDLPQPKSRSPAELVGIDCLELPSTHNFWPNLEAVLGADGRKNRDVEEVAPRHADFH